jgi:hypothetical protein
MSLNKTLDRLFDEIRREAKRNPDFANRLDAVLQLHDSRRDVPDEVIEDIATAAASPASDAAVGASASAEAGGRKRKAAAAAPVVPSAPQPPEPEAPPIGPMLNPVGFFRREGADALAAALEGQDLIALRALVAEHNLDPSGEAADLDRNALAAHVLAQAQRRAERDEKLFDY